MISVSSDGTLDFGPDSVTNAVNDIVQKKQSAHKNNP